MEKLVKIQSELKAPKGQFNSFGKYHYRSCEDILNALKPLLSKQKLLLTLTDEVKEICGVPFVEAVCEVFDVSAGTKVTVSAQAGIDTNKKGMDLSQTFGAASSYARKYALNGMFLIDDTKDADTDEHTKKVKESKPKQSTPQKPWLNPGGKRWAEALDRRLSIGDIKEHMRISKENEIKYNEELTLIIEHDEDLKGG